MFYRLKFRPLKCYFTRIALTFRHKINCYYTNQIAAVVLRRRNLLITSLAAAGFTFHTNGISDAELTELEKHATNQFVKHLADETGWEKFHTDEHITVYRRLMKNGIYEYRCVGSYPDISANDFIKAQYDLEYRKTWDNTLLNFEVLEEDSDSGSQLIRWDSRFGYTFGDRVYVFVQRKSIDPDSKSVSIICKGVDQNVYPLESQNQKSVRVTDYSSEMVIRAHQDMEKEGLDFELISHEDTQLGVPRMVSDYFAKDWGPDYLKKLYKAALKLAQIRQAEMQQQRPEEEKEEKPAEEEAPLSVGKIETDEEEPAKQEDAETVTKEEEATSPQEEEEVESPPEAEEEVPEDPVARYRAECAKEERMQTLKKILEECNERVRTTPDSGESCHMEMVDWVHALDHCAMPKAFRELK